MMCYRKLGNFFREKKKEIAVWWSNACGMVTKISSLFLLLTLALIFPSYELVYHSPTFEFGQSSCIFVFFICCPKIFLLIGFVEQLFPNLDKVVFLDDDVVIQHDLSPLWEIDLQGKVNGAVETCKGEDEWVMSKHLKNYFNFSHPLIAKNLDPDECAWAYGMNIFDLHAWRNTNIRETYHSWMKEVSPTLFSFLLILKILLFLLLASTFSWSNKITG